ncbi:putative ribonuclease H-like domain-containing protein [Tanacetum coccineum]
MDLETAQTTTTAKLPILKQENGNSFKPVPQTTTNVDGTSTTLIPGHVTTEEKVQKKNDVKARSMLLMALPNEHLMTLNQYKDAQTFAPSTESLDSIFNRLQKIVSQLAILGENISQEDLNLKFCRSLPSEWNTHVVVRRNKPDLDTMSFDDPSTFQDCIEKQKVKELQAQAPSSQKYPFVSIHYILMKLILLMELVLLTLKLALLTLKLALLALNQPNGSQLVYEDLEQIHEDDIEKMDLKWQLALLSMRTRRFFQKLVEKSLSMGVTQLDMTSPKWSVSTATRWDTLQGNTEDLGTKIAKTGIKTTLEDYDEVPTNMALMAVLNSEVHNDKTCSKTCLKSFETLKTQLDDLRLELNKSEFNLATYKRGLSSVEEQLVFYKKNAVIFYEQLVVHKRDISYKDSEISMLKSELEKLKQEKESNQLKIKNFDNASKSLDKLIGSQITDKSRKECEDSNEPQFEGYGPQTSKSVSEDISNEVRESPDALLVEELVSDDKLTAITIKRKRVVSRNSYTRVNYNYSAKKSYPSAHRNMVSRAVLIKTSLRSLNTVRPVNTAHPKITVYSARPMPKVVNTARPNSAVVNAVRANQVNAVKPQLVWQDPEDQGYVDSGCSRHMTGNMSYLSNFKSKYADGYSHLVGNPKMCDKKNSVVFADTGCFVLSPDFKLADESQVLLKVPRKNNIYSVNMKNIVPKECLTYLVAKATLDESMLWHRRLGHVNFKTINKLVKENLVRGLPSKRFENDQTCVACLKGKQHKASCKSKIQNSITQPLFMLHIDLFGPTFVSSLMNKKYCLVVTDDYSRFTWVFILATKDETSGILKRFLTETKNLVDKKVKIIRCDNGTEFKNRVMSEFCEEKGITKEFSIARTPLAKWYKNSKDLRMLVIENHNPSSDAGKKDDEGVNKESGIDDQERPENSTQDVNTAGPSINTASTNVNTDSLNINTVSPTVTTAPLEATHADFFGDETKVDMSNITTTYPVPSTPNTRIHKDHSLDHVIGDV